MDDLSIFIIILLISAGAIWIEDSIFNDKPCSLRLHHRKYCKYKYPSNMSRIWNCIFKKQNNNCHVTAGCKIRHNICLWSSEQVQGVVHTGSHLLLSTAFCPWFRHLLVFTTALIWEGSLSFITGSLFHWLHLLSSNYFLVSQNKAGKASIYNFTHWSQHEACLL